MLAEDAKKKLSAELEQKRKEISDLKQRLNQLNSTKEEWFSKKEEYRKQISVLIGDVKSSKEERDKFTSTVKLTKKERDALNESIKIKTKQLTDLKLERDKVKQKNKIDISPSRVREEIRGIEHKIETEVISFDKEKKLMEMIKKKKKQLMESGAISDVWDKIKTLNKEIRDLHRKARSSHRVVQDLAKDSQNKHEHMIHRSTEIQELRKKEEEAFKKFVELKKEFTEQNNLLKEKLKDIGDIGGKLGEDSAEQRKERDIQTKKTIESKKQEVEEKLKTRKKLTTEDILIMQQGN